jgi:hypothetical protein
MPWALTDFFGEKLRRGCAASAPKAREYDDILTAREYQ